MGNSFGYLDLAGIREFLAALAGEVRPGGGLVIAFNAGQPRPCCPATTASSARWWPDS
jgi:hypothetical protein